MPLVLDPADHKVVYVAGTSIARSGDGVVSGTGAWTVISPTTPDSPDSLPGPVPANEINVDTFYANEYGTVSAIAPAKSTGTPTTPCSTIYAGTDTGLVWKTTNADADASAIKWTQLGAGVLPKAWVNSIVVDPTDPNHVLVAFSGYREGDLAANVWETKDGGATWRNISGSLPNAPVWMLTYDKAHNVVYASTNYGVYYHYIGAGVSWMRFGDNLPNAPIFDVKLSADGTAFAADYGRGVYRTQAVPALSSSTVEDLVSRFSTGGAADALNAKLGAASHASGARARDNQLDAFAHEVNAQQGKALTAEQASVLLDLAGALK
jgi:photosystem II stability/assembly factor-like uncharacterized protein